ncbi:hypothetical protein HPB47_025859 [Ixodes persulcatus]|uniref:Uncharacterized protein n=1 Tax=Ixodes persulcatus TaxID=34615 RepID=A0AC60Q107_IXOPE|nr:hypothetical protein HPB47_025859 [Ixodes persulcatus]
MQPGKSSYKFKNCSRRADPSTTRLIRAESDDGSTPTAGNTEFNIGDGDNSESALAGASSEIFRLLVRLSSRLDILTAEVKLLRADNTALRVEVSQLRQAVLNETVVAAFKDATPILLERTATSYTSVAQGCHPKEGQVRHFPATATTRGIPSSSSHLSNDSMAYAYPKVVSLWKDHMKSWPPMGKPAWLFFVLLPRCNKRSQSNYSLRLGGLPGNVTAGGSGEIDGSGGPADSVDTLGPPVLVTHLPDGLTDKCPSDPRLGFAPDHLPRRPVEQVS